MTTDDIGLIVAVAAWLVVLIAGRIQSKRRHP